MNNNTPKNQIFIVSLAKIHLYIIFTIFLFFSLVFFFSDLDLKISAKFYHFETNSWVNNQNSAIHWIYVFGPLPQILLFNFAFIGWIFSYLKSRWVRFRRQYGFIILTILASEFFVEIFKHTFSRPRPRNIELFEGNFPFTPLWVVGEQGLSFPSSHVKSGFIFVMLFYLFYPKYKKPAFISLVFSLVLGGILSYTRILQGGHFLSDCIFSFILSHFIVIVFVFLFLEQKKKTADFQAIFSTPKKLFLYFLVFTIPIVFLVAYVIAFF